MERRTVAKGLLVSALACFGFVLFMGSAHAQDATTVQGTQSARGAGAATGPVVGANVNGFGGGPTAVAAGGASSQQLGSNHAKVSQTGTAKTGDPVAGGQVTGVVGDNATVQNSNSAIGVAAGSGPAVMANVNGGRVGPLAASVGPSQTAQTGSNSLDLSQSGTAETGDAVAGGQVTGIVGDGVHHVQMQNSCIIGCLAFSLPAAVANLNGASVGPVSASLVTAQAGQVGDNDAVISQSSSAKTGDAISGAQVTGGVGGSAVVQNSNNCLLCVSATFPAAAVNLNAAAVGPLAASVLNAQTSQTGDNSTDVAQEVSGQTGDALSGSQVTGWVGDANGFLTVMNQQASIGDAAFSGPVLVGNGNVVVPGPISLAVVNAQSSQNGDNDTVVAQATTASTGDSLAGAQVTGLVGGDITVSGTNSAIATLALSGPIVAANASVAQGGPIALALLTASASQFGDNTNSLDQSVDANTGDAVSGAQVVGAVGSGDATIMVSNSAFLAIGVSGTVAAANLGAAVVGPISAGILNAQSQQTGDNKTAVAQSVATSSGDAVSGGQTIGAVMDGDATISAQNSSIATVALTGASLAFNVPVVFGSPSAFSVLNANASQFGRNDLSVDSRLSSTSGDAVSGGQVIGAVTGGDTTVQNTNSAILALGVSGLATAAQAYAITDGPLAIGVVSGSASQIGDTNLAIDQNVSVTSGDAVSGAAVVGAVADGDVTVSGSNSGILAVALSGPALAGNVGIINGGPVATGILNAQTQQAGDNTGAIAQTVKTESGDAVSGSQITGAVSNDGDIVVAVQNNAIATAALSGISASANLGVARGGPLSLSVLNANASQFGSNNMALSQDVANTSGDAVSGAQITGAVANGSDVTVMGSNSAVGTVALSGPAVGVNVAATQTGPVGLGLVSGSASQFGSNNMAIDQRMHLDSGDAVSGSQITGVVAAADGDVTVSNQNSAIGTLAISGPAVGPNFAFAIGGPAATGLLSAQAQQTGNNSLAYSQDLAISSGDGVAGSQVSGIVGGRTASVQQSDSDTLSLGLSGVVVGFNVAGGGLTPTAVSLVSARVQQNGDSDLNGSANVGLDSGDALSGGQVNGRVGSAVTAGAASSGVAGVPAGASTSTGVSTTTP